MTRDAEFRGFVLDQLDSIEELVCKPMFGGFGIYCGETIFAIIANDRLYFKIDTRSRALFEERGMGPLRPNQKQTLKSYYEVPPDVLEDSAELERWARRAIESQLRAVKR